jgi:4-hydroxythreonine-4-phosphate dehydrogenase
VAAALNTETLVRIGRTLARTLEVDFGLGPRPRIGFCGLNPHAGEEGVLGSEDAAVIAPAIALLQRAGIDASGPWSGDTVFGAVVRGRAQLDAVVAMYHDQGLGPLKTFHGAHAANITCGLPIVRTSVDHGTAYDVAGTSAVDLTSFVYAAELARSIARRRSAWSA